MSHDTQTRERPPARLAGGTTFLPITIVVLALAAPSTLAAQAGQAGQDADDGLFVESAVLTTAVEDLTPADTLSVVPADLERVFLWTRITGAADSTSVAHVWYRDGEEAARVQVPVNSADWRTYTSKRILPSWTGAWRVEVVNADGELLETVSFRVETAADAAAADSADGR